MRLAMCLMVSVTIGCSAYAGVATAAESIYWYGPGSTNCWQSGWPGSSSFACVSVGAGYLPTPGGNAGGLAHMVAGGIYPQTQLGASGDYCGFYELGDNLTSQDSINEGPATGYTTPTPYSSYQEGDAYENACQASGTNWGQEIRSAAPSNNCWGTCGMNHYVSFHDQGTNDRPWNPAFGLPSFVVQADATPQTFVHVAKPKPKNLGAWGYICPVFEDTTSNSVLEYCLQEWRSPYNSARWSEADRIGSCAGAGGKAIDTIQTSFGAGTQFATELPGAPYNSSNTYVWESAGAKHFAAAITASNLQSAINRDRSAYVEGEHPGEPAAGTGCGRTGLSTEPKDYALIGVEQGLEGWREFSELAGSTANLQLSTVYTPVAPAVTTTAPSNVQETQATFNGSVNPNATDTHYFFQYGATTGYGSSAPVPPGPEVGSGGAVVPASTTVSGLLAGHTYHYRIEATNAAGTSYGSDQTFTTPGTVWAYYNGSSNSLVESWWANSWSTVPLNHAMSPGSTPALMRDPTSGVVWTYYNGSGNSLVESWWNGEWSTVPLNFSMAPGSTPAVIRDPTTGEVWVYYTGSNNKLQESWWDGSWHTVQLEYTLSPGSSPAIMRDPTSGVVWVYFNNGSNELEEAWYSSGWSHVPLGYAMSPGSTPSIQREASTGVVWVYFNNGHNELEEAWWNSGWNHVPLGYALSPKSSPAIVRDVSTGYFWVYFNNSSNVLEEAAWEGSWRASPLSHGMSPGSTPAIMRDPATGVRLVYYNNGSNHLEGPGGMANGKAHRWEKECRRIVARR